MALDQPSDKRDDYVRSRPDLSETVKTRTLELLATDCSSNAHFRTGGAALLDEEEPDPERVGIYRILRTIGRGGMGNVYLAERAAGDFDHVVAIKVIKQRLITDEIVERFRRERQILADLNHPNIARLFDGGETESGSPYFVMEYVKGQPLDRWLAQSDRSLEIRLSIFRQICEAVEAAHQRLVVHRDLTPPNVLVTADNTVKLIDFGIARPDSDENETEPHPAGYTPGFAAPEQRSGGAASTLTDIYALGKLLASLLAGEDDRELSAIAAKACDDKPASRYASVSALIEDIDDYRQNRPIDAMGSGRAYVIRKFAVRKRLALSAALAILLVLIAGIVATTIGFQRARIAQSEAEARLADTRDIANLMMFDVFDEVSRVPGTTGARLLIARNAQRYLDQLASDPRASVEERFAAGRGYYRLAMVTGAMDASNTGDLLEGIEFFERSVVILEDVLREAPSDDVRLALAQTLIGLMRAKFMGYIDIDAAIDHGWRARELLLAIEVPTAASVAARVRVQRHLGDMVGGRIDGEEGSRLIEEGVRYFDTVPEGLRTDPIVQRAYNDLIHLRGGLAIFLGGFEDGLPYFYDALEAQRRLTRQTEAPEDYQLEAQISINLGRTLLHIDRAAEAERVITPSHEQSAAAYEIDRRDNALQRRFAMLSLTRAWIAAERGAAARADHLLQEGLRLARLADWPEGLRSLPSLNYAHRLQEAAEPLWVLNRTEEACDIMRRSIAMYDAYADHLELPETTLRYRILRMQERMESCPAGNAGA